ncbi:hypothetical protein C8R44DRAFT_778111 [Mycena epipterygia]|nr:hypothetical protein C8R44DRAFT_778111 [Mycena epipterygia]
MSQASMNLVSLPVTLFLYGIYFNLFLISTYLFVKHSKFGSPLYRSTIFVLGCALFVVVTLNCVLIIVRVFQGFIFFKDGTAAVEFFTDQGKHSQPADEVILDAAYGIAMLISDAMVIFRLWVVSKRSKLIIALPIITTIGFTVFGMLSVKSADRKGVTLLVSIIPTFVFSLVTNIYCTGAIFWKIWNIAKNSAPLLTQGTNLMHFVFMLVESATLYTAWALVYTVLHAVNSETQFVFIHALPAIAGIANSLIQVRMAIGKAIEPPSTQSAVSAAPLQFASVRRQTGHEEPEIKPQALESIRSLHTMQHSS